MVVGGKGEGEGGEGGRNRGDDDCFFIFFGGGLGGDREVVCGCGK